MVNGSKESHDSDKGASETNPILQELRRHLAEPGPWPRRFRRLAEAIVQIDDVTCQECEALLDVYVDAELANEGARRRYPLLWQHLQDCAECAAAHNLLFETLAQEMQGELQTVPQPEPTGHFHDVQQKLSFLESPATDVPWTARLRSRLAGAPFGLTFTLSPAYVQDLFTSAPPLPAGTRGAGEPLQSLPLLAHSIPLGDGQVAVELIATRDDQDPERLHLRATIVGTTTLPANLWAVLTWGDHRYAGPVDRQGQADLGKVPLDLLRVVLEAEKRIFEITFEERGETDLR